MINLRFLGLTGLCIVLLLARAYGQPLKDSAGSDSASGPIYFLDGTRIPSQLVNSLKLDDLAFVFVGRGHYELALSDSDNARGTVIIETKRFARLKYWQFLASGSRRYARLVPKPESDSDVVYIVDGTVNKKDLPYDLMPVDNFRLDSLKILRKRRLRKRYGITGKRLGVMVSIRAK